MVDFKSLKFLIQGNWVVRMRGLEPPRREALGPKPSVYTNFTTSA